MDTAEVLAKLADELAKHQVMGEPVERNGVTVIPVLYFRGGGGIGGRGRGDRAASGEGNGGLGVIARPAGAWVIRGDTVTWQPAMDLNRVILGGQAIGIVALLVLYRLLRRRQ